MGDDEMVVRGIGSGMDFELLAASLRADSADARTWMDVLGKKLAAALPARVRLHHGGLLGNGPVNALAADLGVWQLSLRLEHDQPVGERTHIVRGIALKTEALPLDAWIDALTEALAELAATSAREREAVLRLLS